MEAELIKNFLNNNKEIFFYGGLSICLFYLLFIIIKQSRKIAERNRAIDSAQRSYNASINERNDLKKRLVEEITKDI